LQPLVLHAFLVVGRCDGSAIAAAIVQEAIVQEAIVQETIVQGAIVQEAIVQEAIVQEAGWTPGPFWRGAENLAPPGFDPRTVQPVASRYTDCATQPTWEG